MSLAAAWLFDDEKEDERAERGLIRIKKSGAVVPRLWHLELRNVLLVGERRGRLSVEQTKKRLRIVYGLPIQTDTNSDLDMTLDLARAHRLTFYDSLYLELAVRRRAPLATLDTQLHRAAIAEGLPVV